MTGLIEITTSYSNFRSNFLLFLSFPAASSPSSSPSQVSLLWCLIFPLEEQDNHRLGNKRIVWLVVDLPSLLSFLFDSCPHVVVFLHILARHHQVMALPMSTKKRRSSFWGLSTLPKSIYCKSLLSWHLPHPGCEVKGEYLCSACDIRVLWQQV